MDAAKDRGVRNLPGESVRVQSRDGFSCLEPNDWLECPPSSELAFCVVRSAGVEPRGRAWTSVFEAAIERRVSPLIR